MFIISHYIYKYDLMRLQIKAAVRTAINLQANELKERTKRTKNSYEFER